MRKIIVPTLALFCSFQMGLIEPAKAQSTTLTGLVSSSSMASPEPVLRARVPQYDTSRNTTRVNVGAQRNQNVSTSPRVVTRTVYVEKRDNRTYFQRHPKVKSAVIGAGIGAGTGAIAGLISRRGVLRGGAIGAGTGAGVGLIQSSRTMKRHPIIKNTSTGALAGLGLGAASSRRGGTVAKSTAVGAAVGLGYSLFKKYVR